MARTSQYLWMVDHYLKPGRCRELLASIHRFRETHPLPQIYRPMAERSLRYSVINGRQVAESFPQLRELSARIKALAEEKSGLSLNLMRDELVGININITPPGGEYRWH